MVQKSIYKRSGIFSSFICAIRGLGFAIYSQRNMVVHIVAAVIFILLGLLFKIAQYEWLALIISIFFVLAAESFNTSIEVSIDLVTRKTKFRAMLAKDVAAGAVLLSAINAIIVGYLIFFNRLTNLIIGGL